MSHDKAVDALARDFGTLLLTTAESDVTLAVVVPAGDYVAQIREFKAHKAILAARSPVFSAMFQEQKDSPKKVKTAKERVMITDMDADTCWVVLQYIYTGQVEKGKLEARAFQLLLAADKYEIRSLANRCLANLIAHPHPKPDTVLEMFFYAERHTHSALRDICIEYISTHLHLLKNRPDWKTKIQSERPELMMEIMLYIYEEKEKQLGELRHEYERFRAQVERAVQEDEPRPQGQRPRRAGIRQNPPLSRDSGLGDF